MEASKDYTHRQCWLTREREAAVDCCRPGDTKELGQRKDKDRKRGELTYE